jgi:hypothetical protein
MRRSIPTIALVAAMLLVAAGCSKRSDTGRAAPGTASSCACDGAPVVDPGLMAFLSKARASHHEADLAEDAGDRAGAIRALVRIVDGPVPGATPAPEASEVLADTRARLADLRSAAGDFAGARRDAEAGLVIATQPSHFRGHLLEVAGIVEERRGKALKEKGDLAGAEGAFRLAIEAYERSIATQDEVIRRALGADAAGRPDAGAREGGGR